MSLDTYNEWNPKNPINQDEKLPIEIDPIDDVMERIASLKYILKSARQPYYLTLVERIEDKLITIFQI